MTTRRSEPADLQADYAQAGFDGSLPFGRSPALVVVDVVAAYIEPGSPLFIR